jgi:pyruvate kinase
LIFTLHKDTSWQEIVHALMLGVRIVNIDLSQHDIEEKFAEKMEKSIETFENGSKFCSKITKICQSRGRTPRTGKMRNSCRYKLKLDNQVVLTSDKRYEKCSNNEVCFLWNFARLISKIKPGNEIKIDSKVALKVEKVSLNRYVTCRVVEGGYLESYKKVDIVGVLDASLDLSEEETEDFEIAKRMEFDFILVPGVDVPERFHKLEKLTKGSDLKLIAGIKAENSQIDRIIEHFEGVFIESSLIDEQIITKARNLKKIVIGEFPVENSFELKALNLCKLSDSLLLKPSESSNIVTEAGNNLINLRNFDLKLESDLKTPLDVKAVVCITEKEETAIKLASSHPDSTVIIITKSKEIVKTLQLWRNVHAMFYVDCEGKSWGNQRKEILQIVAMYGKDLKLLKPEDEIVSCCNAEVESEDINCFKTTKISEIF